MSGSTSEFIFNQIAAEQNLDNVVRQMYREEFTYGQCYLGFWWDRGKFTVRGETVKGNGRKKTYDVWYPRAITTLDACKVVPVGMMQFGQERLAWQASPVEIGQYMEALAGARHDDGRLVRRGLRMQGRMHRTCARLR